MPNSRFNEFIIEEIKGMDVVNSITKEKIAHFDIVPSEVKYCFHCSAESSCAMRPIFNYAQQCSRYPNGPGLTREDAEYKTEIVSLYEAIMDEKSILRKQLQELLKLEK